MRICSLSNFFSPCQPPGYRPKRCGFKNRTQPHLLFPCFKRKRQKQTEQLPLGYCNSDFLPLIISTDRFTKKELLSQAVFRWNKQKLRAFVIHQSRTWACLAAAIMIQHSRVVNLKLVCLPSPRLSRGSLFIHLLLRMNIK